jgi:hypothetical protein
MVGFSRIFRLEDRFASFAKILLQGHFIRVSHKEVSVSHPDGIKAILLAPLRKVRVFHVKHKANLI